MPNDPDHLKTLITNLIAGVIVILLVILLGVVVAVSLWRLITWIA